MMKYFATCQITVLVMLVSLAYCLNQTSVALVLYYEDLKSLDTTAIDRKINLTSGSNETKIAVNFYALKKIETSYSQILDETIAEILSANNFVVSFLRGRESVILHEILRYKQTKHLSLSTEDCHLVSNAYLHCIPSRILLKLLHINTHNCQFTWFNDSE